MSATSNGTSLAELSSAELARVGCGPLRSDVRSPWGVPNLEQAKAAIQILGRRMVSGDRDSAAALLEVIQRADWYDTIELALQLFMPAAAVDQLVSLGRHLLACFCDAGERGGGVATLRRLKGVQEQLHSLGVSLVDSVSSEEEQSRLNSILQLADQFARA